MLFNRQKLLYSLAYLTTLLSTFYFSLISRSYLLVIIFSALQVDPYLAYLKFFSLAWLFASSFPAGIAGMKFITKQIINFGRKIVSLIFGNR
jgi:hypothetical protein